METAIIASGQNNHFRLESWSSVRENKKIWYYVTVIDLMSIFIFIWCDFYRSDVHARVTSNWWRQWGVVAPVLARAPITKVHFVQYTSTMVQIVPKYQGALCTLGTMLEHLHCTIVQLIPQLPRCTLYSTVVQWCASFSKISRCTLYSIVVQWCANLNI